MTPKRSLGNRLNSVTVHVNRALRRGGVGGDMPIEYRSALSVIAFDGPLRMSALARAEQVSAAAVTRTVDILVQRRLVRRIPDPSDARATLIGATAAGKRLVLEGRDDRSRRIDRAVRQLPEDAVKRIGAAIGDLEALAQVLGGYDPDRRAPD